MTDHTARHPRSPEFAEMSLEQIADRQIAHFKDRKPDWAAFSDALIDGYRRAQHRFIGNTSGKGDPSVIPTGGFTLSVMYVPPGEGNAAHTHEVEEVFFILQGHLMVFLEDETGHQIERHLGPWDCISCPAGVIHGYRNESVEPVYLQVMLGTGRKPDLMGYANEDLYRNRRAHLEP